MDADDPIDHRRGRVLATLAVARRLADPLDPLGREARDGLGAAIASSTAGIELALSEYLETDPGAAEVTSLVEGASRAPRCHVILSSSVCVAALRAIALGVATAPHVFVKPSRRDPVLARLLVRELSASAAFRDAGGHIAEVSDVTATAPDVVHAYGADETLDVLARALPPGVGFVGHGTGFGVAVVQAHDVLVEAAVAVSRDVVVFDQRGCLSPRLVVVEGQDRAASFARALFEALGDDAVRVPRAPLDAHEASEVAGYVELMRSVGEVLVGDRGIVGVDLEPESVWIGPACRVVHVIATCAESVAELLSPIADRVTTLGASRAGPFASTIAAACPCARRAPLGAMQRPPFDGPVDLRPPRSNPAPPRFSG